jgi:membrane protein required for colicin V production
MISFSHTMNLLDVILAVPLIWFIYRGFVKGLILGIISLASLILGVYLGFRFSGPAADMISAHFHVVTPYLNLIAFAVIFLVVIIILFIFGKLLEKAIDLLALGFLNKLLGALFGLAKGIIFVSLILFIINLVDVNHKLITDKNREGSTLYKPLSKVVPRVLELLKLQDIRLNRGTPDNTTLTETGVSSRDGFDPR